MALDDPNQTALEQPLNAPQVQADPFLTQAPCGRGFLWNQDWKLLTQFADTVFFTWGGG